MPEVRYVEANGLRFAFLEQGAGPLVLLVHGFPDTAHTWDDVRPLIAAKGYRAVSPFIRGYFPTALPATDDPLAEVADYRRASRMFTGNYVIEQVPGGHFLHREHPGAFAERLLAHL
jgi:pimeloyl-ACP methyl ester carboxylesterase